MTSIRGIVRHRTWAAPAPTWARTRYLTLYAPEPGHSTDLGAELDRSRAGT